MTWAKLDDRLHSNRKVRKAGLEAMGLWVIGLSYCAFELTDGFIDHEWIQMWSGPKTDELCARLVASGLWSEVDGGYQYNDYLDYNPSAKDVLAAREQSNARQMRRRKKGSAEHVTDDVTHVVTRESRRDNESTPSEVTRESRHKSRVSHMTPDPDPDPDPVPNPIPPNPPSSAVAPPVSGTRTVGGGVVSDESPPSLPSSSQASRDRGSGTLLQSKLAKAYAEGIQQAAPGVPYPVPRDPADLLALEDITAAHFHGNAGVFEAPSWVTASAKKYRIACADRAQYESGFSPRRWAAWVRSGEQTPIADTRRGQGVAKRDGEQPPPLPPYYKPFQFEPRVKVTPEEAERRIRSLEALKPRSVREAEAEAARIKAANSVEPEEEAG